MKSKIDLYNTCKVTIHKPDGSDLEFVNLNITCDIGRASIIKRLGGVTTTQLGVIKYVAIGTGTATPAVTDIALGSEQHRTPVLTEYTEIDDTTLVIYARFNPGFTIEATEAGLFIDSTATASNGSGSLLARTKFDTPITKDTDDAMTIEWTVNVINGVA